MLLQQRDSKPRPEGKNRAGDAILAAGKSCQAGLSGAERKQADADDRFRIPPLLTALLTFRLAGSGDVIVTENGKVVKPDADGWYTVSAGARIVVDYPVMVLPKTGDMPVWRWLLGL